MIDLFDYSNPPAILRVRVTPKAKAARIKKEKAPNGDTLYKVYVTAVAEDGKANEAVIKLLAEALDVPKSAVVIKRGMSSRDKIILINR